MSSVNVDFVYLKNLKDALEKNAVYFEDTGKSIGNAINAILSSDWQDDKSEQFRTAFFEQSDPDIKNLVKTMREFANYLSKKIAILERYHSTNINFR